MQHFVETLKQNIENGALLVAYIEGNSFYASDVKVGADEKLYFTTTEAPKTWLPADRVELVWPENEVATDVWESENYDPWDMPDGMKEDILDFIDTFDEETGDWYD